MNKIKVVAVSVFVLLVVFGAQHLPGLFVLNNARVVWTTLDENQPEVQIENSVVDGASCFLKGHAEVLLVLDKIELANTAGLDYIDLQKNLDAAITHMENARVAYQGLITTANESSYNPKIIQKLKKFNYKGFQKEKGLNPFIFDKLVKYLNSGNVRGVFTHFYAEVGTILTQLYDLKSTVTARTNPEVSKLWRLNQTISETQLFGQYAAEVFMTLEY